MSKIKDTIGIIVGGGPAPGINGVISSATIEAVNRGKRVVGIVGGFNSLFEGNVDSIMPLTIDNVSRLHATGGSILRTSRDKPENAQAKFKTLLKTLKQMGIRYLITVGGEGSLFMAQWIEKEAHGEVSVAHTPKTIDNDIPLPGGLSTFGYQTARHLGVHIVQNLMEDAKTTGRWYFVTTMGRHAGHLALGIGKAAGTTLTLIPEEFTEKELSFKKVADVLAGAVIKRISMGKDHGVAVFAEGISEKFDREELSRYEEIEKDETGRIRLSEIQLGRVLKNFVQETLAGMGLQVTIVDKNIGYELRAAAPIPIDIDYTRNLGYGAVHFLLGGGSGSLITFYDGHIMPVPFSEMMDPVTNHARVRMIDINSMSYRIAREYMIRLEEKNFQSQERLEALASTARMTPEEFRSRFHYILE